jgi:thiol-disulfide isomerase/thioredoxin
MKKIIGLVVCLIIFQNLLAQTRISGNIKNFQTTAIKLEVFDDWALEPRVYEANLDTQGNFSFAFELKELGYVVLEYDTLYFSYYIIEPQDAINLIFDANDVWNTCKINGKGSEKWQYEFQAEYKWDYRENWRKKKNYIRDNNSIEQYFAFLDTCITLRTNHLKTYKDKVSSEFYQVALLDIQGLMNSFKAMPLIDVEKLRKKEHLKNNLIQIAPQTDLMSKSLNFGNYLERLALIQYLDWLNVKADTLGWQIKSEYEFMKVFFTNTLLRDRIISSRVKGAISFSSEQKDLKYIYEDFLQICQNQAIKDQLIKLWRERESREKGNPALNFTLKDAQNRDVNLADFKGKVIYLDFWASWCGPCIAQVPHLNKIKQHFAHNDQIVFLYVSVDNDKTKWQSAIQKNAISGVHLITQKATNDDFLKEYGVVGFPTSFIIDKNLQFFEASPPHPQLNEGKDLIKLLESALSEQ